MIPKNSNYIVQNTLKYDIYDDVCSHKHLCHNAAQPTSLEYVLFDHPGVENLQHKIHNAPFDHQPLYQAF